LSRGSTPSPGSLSAVRLMPEEEEPPGSSDVRFVLRNALRALVVTGFHPEPRQPFGCPADAGEEEPPGSSDVRFVLRNALRSLVVTGFHPEPRQPFGCPADAGEEEEPPGSSDC